MTERPTSEGWPTNERLLLDQIYRRLRETLASRKYYATRLTRLQRQSRTIEIVLALAAPGAVGGWAIWHTEAGERVWSLVAAVVVIVTVLRPLMNWQVEIERRTALHMEFTELFLDLELLVNQIASERGVSPETKNWYREWCLRYVKTAKNEDPVRSKRLQRRCREEAESEIPAEKLWIPPPDVTDSPQPSLPE